MATSTSGRESCAANRLPAPGHNVRSGAWEASYMRHVNICECIE